MRDRASSRTSDHLLDERIGGLQTRTLVLWGDADKVFDVSGANILKAKLKGADIHILPGIGHLPMMETPKESSRLYADFLRKIRVAGSWNSTATMAPRPRTSAIF